MNLYGSELLESDFQKLETESAIKPDLARQALLRRVDSVTGGEIVGANGAGDYAGILFPYIWPGNQHVREYRLRRDNPDLEHKSDGGLRERRKYLSPPGRGNMLYFVPGTAPAWLEDVSLSIVITEGEKKTLALWGLAWNGLGDAADKPRFLPVGLPGVWNWRGTIGKESGPNGERRDVKGPIPDLSKIAWRARQVIIVFDSNINWDASVQAARRNLAAELVKRGAKVLLIDLPQAQNVNGIDDLIGVWGPERVLALLGEAYEHDWKAGLLRGRPRKNDEQGPILPVLANAITALTEAPELAGMVRFDSFASRLTVARTPPWGSPEPGEQWTDQEDRKLAECLQRAGIMVAVEIAGMAAQTVAMEHQFNPVQDYLNALQWDGKRRVNTWLSRYLGVQHTKYVSAVGCRFLVAAVARVLSPEPVKSDCVLVLEGPQGTFKSTAAKTLFLPWFTDHLPDLSNKDAYLQLAGVWCVEIAELETISRATATKIKSFFSADVDRYRLPYGKRAIDVPRRCVFLGTTNKCEYLGDETGARRFWPIKTGVIKIADLKLVRDQLWAEAVQRYQAGAKWWLDSDILIKEAGEQQSDRYEEGPWDALIAAWLDDPSQRFDEDGHPVGDLSSNKESVTSSDILLHCVGKEQDKWMRADSMSVAKCLRHLGWERYNHGSRDNREWRYRRGSK